MTRRGHDYVPAKNAVALWRDHSTIKLQPAGRICWKCNAVLSKWNSSDECWCHQDHRITG